MHPNHKRKILMLLTNPFSPDPRVLSEARSLVGKYEVTICAIDQEEKYPKHERIEGIEIRRFGTSFSRFVRRKMKKANEFISTPQWDNKLNNPSVKSSKCYEATDLRFERFLRIALLGLRWISRNFYIASLVDRGFFYSIGFALLRYHFDVVHCHDLDTLLLGVVLGKLKGAKIIFDAHEDYAAMVGFYKGERVAKRLFLLENILMKYIDAIIVVGEIMKNDYKKRTKNPIYVVGNWKNGEDFEKRLDKIHSSAFQAKKDGKLIVSFLSGISNSRIIFPLIDAAAADPDVFLIVAGGRDDNELAKKIGQKVEDLKNGLFLGWVSQDTLNAYFTFTDVVYYCLNALDRNNKYSAPNTLFSTLIAGKAIITTRVGEVGLVVEKNKCGIVISKANEKNILAAFEELKNSDKLKWYQNNSLKAAKLYNWKRAEKNLFKLYSDILDKN